MTASSSSCSFKSYYSSRKLTRLIWTLVITVFICFWTYFLYYYTNNYSNVITAEKYTPIAFLQQKQQKLFDSSLIKSSKLSDSVPNTIYATLHQGHNRTDIESLLLDNNHIILIDKEEKTKIPVADVTVLLQLTSEEEILNIKTQINSILSQSIQPKYIWIFYNHDSAKNKLERTLRRSKIQIKFIATIVNNTELLHVRDASWLLQHTPITTEFTWIMEPNTIPDSQYLYYTYGLLKTEEYKSKLIGYETSLLLSNTQVECLQSNTIDKAQPVDMIHGSWLLRTSWVQLLRQEVNPIALDLPLAYFISSSLLYRAAISSIAIPSKLKPISPSSSCLIQTAFTYKSVLPDVVDQQRLQQQKGRIVLLLDGAEHAIELFPLMCRLFNQQNIQVHVILANGLTGPTFQDTMDQIQCIHNNNGNVMIHDLTMAYNNGVSGDLDLTTIDYVAPITRLLEFIEAQILIQIKCSEDSYFYRAIQSVAEVQNITAISLPVGQVAHSLWISDLSIEALQHWNDIKVDLVVITDRRPQSLSRLLESTNNAFYLGDDHVELAIHMEQSADTVTRNLVQVFEWQHGSKKVRHRIRKGGLMPAIVESWYPCDNHNYGVLLEDDIELSPLFYSWSKYNILKYRYSPNEKEAYQHIYGVSLYSPRNLELLPEGRRPFNPEPVLEEGGYSKRAPYATQIPCSWGAVYFPEHWREFHTYLTERIEKEDLMKGHYNITVPNSRSERWKKSWKKYFIELVYLRAYVMVYPNFEQFESFSTNHLEYGTHVKENGRTQSKVEQFLVPLMQRDTILDQLPNQHLPTFDKLPVMDLWGRIRTLEELNRVGDYWHQRVSTCQRAVGTFDPSDLFCPFDENVVKAKEKKQNSSKRK